MGFLVFVPDSKKWNDQISKSHIGGGGGSRYVFQLLFLSLKLVKSQSVIFVFVCVLEGGGPTFVPESKTGKISKDPYCQGWGRWVF